MAEFKITSELDAQVADFLSAGGQINQSFSASSTDGVETLAAACAFVDEQKKLRKLMALYAKLVAKDAQDLASMIKDARENDEKIGVTIR